jgi:hypothetical protein
VRTDIGLRHLISHLTVTARCFACKTRRRLRQFSTLEKPYCKSILFLFKCYFCKFLWQSNLKSIICFHIPLNPSVRRVRRVYTLILNFTLNYAMYFSKKTINPTCQCFLLVTFLSRKKSNTHPYASLASLASPRPLRSIICFSTHRELCGSF